MSDYLKTFTFTLLLHLAHLEWDYTLEPYRSRGSYLYGHRFPVGITLNLIFYFQNIMQSDTNVV